MLIKGERAPGKSGNTASAGLIANIGALTITVLLFILGAQPFAVGLFPAHWDKIAHFIVFALITSLLWIGSAGRRPVLVIVLVSLIGIFDEWRQAWLPGRSMDLADLAVDISAAIFTVIVLQIMRRNCAVASANQP